MSDQRCRSPSHVLLGGGEGALRRPTIDFGLEHDQRRGGAPSIEKSLFCKGPRGSGDSLDDADPALPEL